MQPICRSLLQRDRIVEKNARKPHPLINPQKLSSLNKKQIAKISKIKPINLSSDDERTFYVNKKWCRQGCKKFDLLKMGINCEFKKAFFVDG